jgi:hypothetical protein
VTRTASFLRRAPSTARTGAVRAASIVIKELADDRDEGDGDSKDEEEQKRVAEASIGHGGCVAAAFRG